MLSRIFMGMSLFFFISCSLFTGKKQNDELQVQDGVLRFYSRFNSILVNTYRQIPSFKGDLPMGERALQRYLSHSTEALKIATGSHPVPNLLDMLVFIRLNRAVTPLYWSQYLPPDEVQQLAEVFIKAESELNDIALTLMKKEELKKIHELSDYWLQDNPNYLNVDQIRLSSFSQLITTKQSFFQGFSLTNFITGINSAVAKVDDVVLVSNRGIFLAQELPTIIRIQARLGAREISDDMWLALHTDEISTLHSGIARDTLPQVHGILQQLLSVLQESQEALKSFREAFPRHPNPNPKGGLGAFNELLMNLSDLLNDTKIDPAVPHKLKNKFAQLGWIILTAFFAMTAIFWGIGYLFFRLGLSRWKKQVRSS